MTVKIDNSNNPLHRTPGWDGKARSPAEKPGDNAPSTAACGTSVNIGATSMQLHSMESDTENTPMNALKLAEIKQAISEGRFKVNPGIVADSLIKTVTDLIGSHKA